ncbi:MAG: TM2 domain-containing protein [Chitinophagales bacterium]|jgi:TM2 domain-containing membrane protein YozV|nr:TM2 domain-containing protein [Chitinophagales bacterium]
MKKLLVLITVLFAGVQLSSASSYKLDAVALETKFSSAEEISMDEINVNISNLPSLSAAEKDKVMAGLLGIVCGGLGLHRFYMGQNKAGFIYLGAFCGLSLIYGVISVVTAGIGSVLFPMVMVPSLIGAIDGVMYLIATDEEFKQKYLGNQKFIQWL